MVDLLVIMELITPSGNTQPGQLFPRPRVSIPLDERSTFRIVFVWELSIRFFSVLDPKDEDTLSLVVYLVKDPIVATSDTIAMRPAEFLRSVWSRIVDEERNPGGNSLNLFGWECVEVALGRGLKYYFVYHALSGIVAT